MSWGVKNTFFEAPFRGVTFGGSGVSIGGGLVILRVIFEMRIERMMATHPQRFFIEPENDGLVQMISYSRGVFSGSSRSSSWLYIW